MRIVMRWIVAGAVVPACLLLLTFVPVAIAMGPRQIVSNIGMLLLAITMLAPPGALAGLAVGSLDVALARFVRGETSQRATRVALACSAMFAAVAAATNVLLLFTSSGGLTVLQRLVTGSLIAALPTVVCYFRYRRLTSALNGGQRGAPQAG